MTWRQLLTHWRLIEADLHERYGIDTGDHELMRTRSWFWFRDRIYGLLSTPPVLQIQSKKKSVLAPATRIQWELNPPSFEE